MQGGLRLLERSSVAAVLAVAVGGGALYALNLYVTNEAESGTVSSTASIVSDSSASGSLALKFGTESGPACEGAAIFEPTGSDPWGSCWPGDSNTGVPAGESLTIVNGDQVFDSSYDGQTISNREFRGFVRVTGSNITFRNCWFRGGSATSTNRLLNAYDAGAAITVTDSEFTPMYPSVYLDGIRAQNTTLVRVKITNVVDGLKAGSNVTIQDSYIRDMSWYASDPKQGGGQTHNDGIQILNGSNIRIMHNTILPAGTYGSNAAIQITQDQGTVDSVLVERNMIDYGGCTLNIDNTPLSSLSGVSVRDNHFGRNQRFNNCTVKLGGGVSLASYTGNVWGDTGTSIPPPQ